MVAHMDFTLYDRKCRWCGRPFKGERFQMMCGICKPGVNTLVAPFNDLDVLRQAARLGGYRMLRTIERY